MDRSRDAFVGTVRVVSLGWVVVFHWIALLPQLRHGTYTDRTVTAAVPGLWPLTWLIDVVPLFMFVGGFANARSFDAAQARGEPALRRPPLPAAAGADAGAARGVLGAGARRRLDWAARPGRGW